jgi:hypothetical protein
MFHVETDPESKEHVLVAPGGGRIPVRDDVWERLRDSEMLYADWKKLVQKWSIHVGEPELLKSECSNDEEYRRLRTVIRVFGTDVT